MSGGRRALVVGAAPSDGAETFYGDLIASADYVIAADAGLAVCERAGRPPDLCVGDFDSVDRGMLERAERAGVAIRRYPVEKDESDLDLALDAARAQGACRVDLTAAFSGRIDHTLAAFGTLLAAADLQGRALEPRFTAYALSADSTDTIVLTQTPPDTISVFAIDGPAMVTIKGVRYPLQAGRIGSLGSLGLSNEPTEPVQRVCISSGRCLVIVSR